MTSDARATSEKRGGTSRGARFSVGPVQFEVKNHKQRWSTDVYHHFMEVTWPRLLLLLFLAYLLTNVVFAALYWLGGDDIYNARHRSFADAFWFSVQTHATIGYGSMSPATTYAHVLVTLEAFVGMLSTALTTGVLFAKFSRPSARILFSDKLVVHRRQGRTLLQLRLANQRRGTLSDVSAKLSVVIDEPSEAGHLQRRPHELLLLQPHMPMMVLAWEVTHVIDDKSPLFGMTMENVPEKVFGVVIALKATDDTTAESVSARHLYAPDKIVYGARFAAMVDGISTAGVVVMDCARLHDTEPVDAISGEEDAITAE